MEGLPCEIKGMALDPIVHLKIVPFFKYSIRKSDIVTRCHKANMSTFMNFLI